MRDRALLPATEEMRECCSLLSDKMLHWPGVKMFHLFGTCAFYHRKVMFAMLPDTRSLDGAHAISFKRSHDAAGGQEEDWQTFEITDFARVSDALASLEKAYQESKSVTFKSAAIAVAG